MALVYFVFRRTTMNHIILGFVSLALVSITTAQAETHWNTLIIGDSLTGFAVEGAIKVDVSTAKTLHDRGVRFIDARWEHNWEKGHIPGASSLAFVNETALMEIVGKKEEVVFYCSGSGCNASPEACAKALTWGYEKVYYFAKGLPGWESAGHPIEKAN
jgi:rhodanese-related sulfurtransferase